MSFLHAHTPPIAYIPEEATARRRMLLTIAIGVLGAGLLVLSCPGQIDSQPVHIETSVMQN